MTNGPGEGKHHGGSAEAIDLAVNEGTPPVYPCKPGKVVFAGWDNTGFGNLVKVLHRDGKTSYYAHLRTITVGKNQEAGYTTKLGEVDCTGRYCTGNHLHFEVRDEFGNPVPVRYLVAWNPGCPPCEGPSGTANGEEKPPPNGQWDGVVNQQDATPLYPVVMVLTDCTVGGVCGSTDYAFEWDGTSCGGNLTFLGVFDGRYRFHESITQGTQICEDNGTIDFQALGEGQWLWNWDKPGTQYHADAVLEKTE